MFYGLQLYNFSLPVLYSISGCSGGGSQTSACLPDQAVLTFTGAHLTDPGNPNTVGLQYGGGSSSVNIWLEPSYPNNTANDTVITLALADVYQFIVRDEAYNGTQGIFFRYTGGTTTNSLNISFAPLPPPIVLSVSAVLGCNLSLTTASPPQVFNCVGGVSALQLWGHYFVNPTVTVGGLNCYMQGQGITSATPLSHSTAETIHHTQPSMAPHRSPPSAASASVWCSWSQATYLACLLPQLPSGALYDVNVTNAGGSLLLPQLVGFSALPQVASLASAECGVDPQASPTTPRLKCFGGELLTLSGSHFRADLSEVQVAIIDAQNSSSALYCLQPQTLSATSLTCTLPTPPATFAGLNSSTFGFSAGSVRVQVAYDSELLSNSLFVSLYQPFNAPEVSAVAGSGCSVPTWRGRSMSVTGCTVDNGGQMTVTGANFAQLYSTMQQAGGRSGVYCNAITTNMSSSTTMVCRLGGLSSTASQPVALYVVTGDQSLTSPVFYVSWAGNSTDTDRRSTSSPPWVIAVSVLSSLAVVAAVAALLCWLSRRRQQKQRSLLDRQSATGSDDFSEPSGRYRSGTAMELGSV